VSKNPSFRIALKMMRNNRFAIDPADFLGLSKDIFSMDFGAEQYPVRLI